MRLIGGQSNPKGRKKEFLVFFKYFSIDFMDKIFSCNLFGYNSLFDLYFFCKTDPNLPLPPVITILYFKFI